MTVLEHETDSAGHHHDDKPVAVAVITPSGFYPDADDYNRSYRGEVVAHVLRHKATSFRALHLFLRGCERQLVTP
jgi:hypothetical protein